MLILLNDSFSRFSPPLFEISLDFDPLDVIYPVLCLFNGLHPSHGVEGSGRTGNDINLLMLAFDQIFHGQRGACFIVQEHLVNVL